MKLAVSNIAWAAADDMNAAKLLVECGIKGVEIAPTKKWPEPTEVGDAEIRTYRDFWKSFGIEIIGMQALLFGKPALTLFESDDRRAQTLRYLKKIATLGGKLGARALVFGSPKSRLLSGKSFDEAFQIAVKFFRELGTHAADEGTCICIEANPTDYGCDFLTTSTMAEALVREVASPGVGLHLDVAAMYLSHEKALEKIAQYARQLQHFHLSAPQLAPLDSWKDAQWRDLLATLERRNYQRYVSIETKESPAGLAEVRRSIDCVLKAWPQKG